MVIYIYIYTYIYISYIYIITVFYRTVFSRSSFLGISADCVTALRRAASIRRAAESRISRKWVFRKLRLLVWNIAMENCHLQWIHQKLRIFPHVKLPEGKVLVYYLMYGVLICFADEKWWLDVVSNSYLELQRLFGRPQNNDTNLSNHQQSKVEYCNE